MAESSTQKLFSFKLTPASTLKHAIESLSDPGVNSEGVGKLDVTEHGVEITVRNPNNKVSGYLNLKASGLIDFQFCNDKHFESKMINLNDVSFLLDHVTDNETITIFHLDDSTKLSFIFGSDPVEELDVEMLPMNPEFEKFPDVVVFFCEAIILNEAMRAMIDHLNTVGKEKLVSVDISERLVSVVIGQRPWVYKYEAEILGTRGMSTGQRHHAWFFWRHLDALKKASVLTAGVLICFLSLPNNHVMMRFNLKELGDLAFISKASMTIRNSDLIPKKADSTSENKELDSTSEDEQI